jgi:hypothetical protein
MTECHFFKSVSEIPKQKVVNILAVAYIHRTRQVLKFELETIKAR